MVRTKLQHSDSILEAPRGAWLMACEPVSGVNMREGGAIRYDAGARFRVKVSDGTTIWCDDEGARSVTFDRDGMQCLEVMQRAKT